MYGKKINELVVERSSGEREGTHNHMYMYSMPSLTPYGDSFATFLQLQHMRFPFLLVQVSRPRKPRMKLADTTSGESSRDHLGILRGSRPDHRLYQPASVMIIHITATNITQRLPTH